MKILWDTLIRNHKIGDFCELHKNKKTPKNVVIAGHMLSHLLLLQHITISDKLMYK
jgi:hypothetical protein